MLCEKGVFRKGVLKTHRKTPVPESIFLNTSYRIHLAAALKVLKLLEFVLFYFFISLNIMLKTFSRTMVLYLIAKVNKTE